MKTRSIFWPLALLPACAFAQQDNTDELAKKLSNPVAALISVPLQYNYDRGYGPQNGHKSQLNVQPVIPISLNDDWNVISRTIVPIVSQTSVQPGSSQSGLGDITQSLFFSPKAPTSNGIIWGVGPVLLLPTGSEPQLSARKWGGGPTFVVLKQSQGWTYGLLANHIWGVGGTSYRSNVSASFVQPFLSFTTPDAWTYGLNAESSYNWKTSQWTVPVNVTVAKLVRFGTQPVSLGAGVRYWAKSPEGGPQNFALRLSMTFLFPK